MAEPPLELPDDPLLVEPPLAELLGVLLPLEVDPVEPPLVPVEPLAELPRVVPPLDELPLVATAPPSRGRGPESWQAQSEATAAQPRPRATT